MMTDLFLGVLDHIIETHTLRGILFLRYMRERCMRIWTNISANGDTWDQEVRHALVHALKDSVKRGKSIQFSGG